MAFDTERAAKALGDIGKHLRKAANELYPGVSWKQWPPEMWNRIYERAERQWEDDQRQ